MRRADVLPAVHFGRILPFPDRKSQAPVAFWLAGGQKVFRTTGSCWPRWNQTHGASVVPPDKSGLVTELPLVTAPVRAS